MLRAEFEFLVLAVNTHRLTSASSLMWELQVDIPIAPHQIANPQVAICWHCQNITCSKGDSGVFLLPPSNLVDPISHPSQTMRITFVLAVVAALTASTSAASISVNNASFSDLYEAETDAGSCPLFCLRKSNCQNCPEGNCVVYICF